MRWIDRKDRITRMLRLGVQEEIFLESFEESGTRSVPRFEVNIWEKKLMFYKMIVYLLQMQSKVVERFLNYSGCLTVFH